MIYVVTEDQNSARKFWLEVMRNYWKASEYEVISLEETAGVRHAGNFMLSRYFDDAFRKASKGDMIFVAFDNIGKSTREEVGTGRIVGFDSEYFLTNCIKKCRLKEISFCTTYYYCFEEIFLSYSELLELYKADCKSDDISDILAYVANCILNGDNYFDREHEYGKRVSNLRKDALQIREHFADALLYHASVQIRHGLFTIGKQADKFVKCWIMDCDWLCKNDKVLKNNSYMCAHCKYSEKRQSSPSKLQSVKSRSLLKNGFWIEWC